MPVCSYTPFPSLTKEAKATKFQGVIRLTAYIQRDGRITNIHVIEGAGLGMDEAAIKALKRWKCKPAIVNGKADSTEITFQFDFGNDRTRR